MMTTAKMTTVGLLDGYQCRCEWEEDGIARIILISTDKSLAWSGVVGKDLIEDKSFRKKVAGEEDVSDKVIKYTYFQSTAQTDKPTLCLGTFRCVDKCLWR